MRPNRRVLMIFPRISYAKAIPQHSKTALSRDVPTEISVVDTTRNRAIAHATLFARHTRVYTKSSHFDVRPHGFCHTTIPQHNKIALSRDVPTEISVVDTPLETAPSRTQHYSRDTHAYALKA